MALESAAVTFDASLVMPCPPTRLAGQRITRWISEQDPGPTAAICYNDAISLWLFRALMQQGFVPGMNFALIGHEDVDEVQLVDPPLSVTRVLHEEMGRRTAAALLNRIENPDTPPQRTVLKTELVVRGTCGVQGPAAP